MYQIELVTGEDTKLAELIIEYPNLLEALSNLNIKLGFGEKTIREIAARYQLNLEAFTAIICAYSNKQGVGKTVRKEALNDILVFLKNSHNSFEHKQIPELKSLIALFANKVSEKQGSLLISFFDGYIREVCEHFRYEEETVFPYIKAILGDHRPNGFAIREYEKNHTDIEQKLYDLKNILIKYMPEASDSDSLRQILHCLLAFEKQLSYHTNLEKYVLAPSVRDVEAKNDKAK
ncbi:cation-binding protein [Bacteroidia bacterium]|nr:cation-binding protein [Bacteroidia bacterium]GHV08913.1 cation-binding protein [Bacteroidia bacterium]